MKELNIKNVNFEQEDFHPKGIGSVSLNIDLEDSVLEVYGEYGYSSYHAKWGFFMMNEDQKEEIEKETGLDADALEEQLEDKLNEHYGVDFSRYHEINPNFEPAIYGTNLSEPMVKSILRYDEVDMDEVDAVWDMARYMDIELPEDDIRYNPITIHIFDHSVELEIDPERDQMVSIGKLGELLKEDGVSDPVIEKVKLAANYLVREKTDEEGLGLPYSTDSIVKNRLEADRKIASSSMSM